MDTVGLLALWDESDQWHQPAQRAFEKLKADKTVLTTTTLILFECGNAAARRPYRTMPLRLWNHKDGRRTNKAKLARQESSIIFHSPSCAD